MKSKKILKILASTFLALSTPMSHFSAVTFATTETLPEEYTLRILTFEDEKDSNYWSTLIATDQYSDPLLYGSTSDESQAYKWHDKGNTELSHVLPFNYDAYSYWGGGHAISNYASTDFETYGDYMSQLTVFQNKELEEGVLSRKGGGNNGSDNFAVHFGYSDSSGFNATTTLPSLTFADKKARVIDHMYVNVTTYPLYCYFEGNGFAEPLGENDWVKIIATGYNGNEKTNSSEFYLVNFAEDIFILNWTRWDLSELGAVTKVEFNMSGSSDNGYGFSQPSYFAYDDVAVRFEKPSASDISVFESETPDTYHYSYHLNASEIESGKSIMALYSGNELVGIDIKDINNSLNNVSGNIAVKKNPDRYKIMLWDGLDNPTPLCNAYKGNLN